MSGPRSRSITRRSGTCRGARASGSWRSSTTAKTTTPTVARPVHQPGRRGRLHRQVAEEDARLGAQVRRKRRRTARCGFPDASHELGEPRCVRGVVDRVDLVRGRRRPSTAGGVTYPEWDVNRKALPARLVHGARGGAADEGDCVRGHRRRDRGAASAGAARDGAASPAPAAAGRRHRHRRRRRGARRGAWPARCPTRRCTSTVCVAAATCRCCCCWTSRVRRPSRAPSDAPCTSNSVVAAANLTVALHDLGDRVALYAYYSQGRAAVNMVPVKRFDDHLDARVIRRLNSLEPGGVLAAGGGDPARCGGAGETGRYVAAAAGRAVRRTGLRPRLRA